MRSNLRKLVRLMIESEATVPITNPPPPYDPFADRKRKMEILKDDLAEALNLADVRYLSRSKRMYGAYTFSAVDERNENVVLKVQPLSELEGYRRAQQTIVRLPDRVARHLPMIYKIRTLDELGVRPPADDFGNPEELGVIVMERLEEIPGNMFDLITQPPVKSMHSLESLVRDREAFTAVIDDVVGKTRRAITLAVAGSPRGGNADEEVERLRRMLVSAAYDPEITAPSGGIVISTIDGLRSAIEKKVQLWFRGLGEPARRGKAQSLTMTIMSSISSSLGRRAIPREPMKQSPGPLSRIRGVKELMTAIEDLKSMNINPDDLHGNNIMMRPETGELVLADLGHFT
jgi:hypothetical protein